MSLTNALLTKPFPHKDELLAALATAGIDTVDGFKYFNGGGLSAKPCEASSIDALLDAAKVHNNTIDKATPAWRTIVAWAADQLATAPAASNQQSQNTDAEAQRKEADTFGNERYGGLTSLTLARPRAAERVDGARLRDLYHALDKGTMTRNIWVLQNLKGTLSSEGERKATLGGLEVTMTTATAEPTKRNGEVLLLIWRFLKMLLAVGARSPKPHSTNPQAASMGEHGIMKMADPANPGHFLSQRWHCTPDQIEQYYLAAVHASCVRAAAHTNRARPTPHAHHRRPAAPTPSTRPAGR